MDLYDECAYVFAMRVRVCVLCLCTGLRLVEPAVCSPCVCVSSAAPASEETSRATASAGELRAHLCS